MSKYDIERYDMKDNQAINRVRVDSSKTRNRGAFLGSLAALVRNLKFATYLKFATCGNTNKINEMRCDWLNV